MAELTSAQHEKVAFDYIELAESQLDLMGSASFADYAAVTSAYSNLAAAHFAAANVRRREERAEQSLREVDHAFENLDKFLEDEQ